MKKGKIAAYLLASAITLTSCGSKEAKENKKVCIDDLLCTEIVYSEEEVLTNLDKIYDEYTNNRENFDLMDRNDVLDAAILERNIKESNVNQEEVIKELNLLLECYVANYDMTEEEYLTSFETLLKTYGPGIEIYYPLAECMHLYSCPLNHEMKDGVLTCDEIKNYKYAINFAANFKKDENFIMISCLNSSQEEIRESFTRLYNSGIKMSILLDELNSVYYFGQVPTDLGEEWEYYFSNLESTLDERESLFDTYYSLAVYIHKLECPYKHTKNEYDAITCDNMKLKNIKEE